MGSYREQCIKAKAVKAGIVEQRPIGSRNKKARPVVIEHRKHPNYHSAFPWPKDWEKWGAYRTLAEAEAVIAQQSRKLTFYEFRVRP